MEAELKSAADRKQAVPTEAGRSLPFSPAEGAERAAKAERAAQEAAQ